MANVVADKLEQAIRIKDQIRTTANAKNAGIPEGAPFADYPGYLENLPEQVEDMPIALDFSEGDMEIIAPDGVVVKSATIQKPANLIPENIAEGVNIAGIVGALAGGGGVGEKGIEYTLNDDGDIIKAKLINMPVWTGVNFIDTLEEIDASESPGIGQELPQYGCYGCTNLRSVTLPANVTKIGAYFFYKCTNLSQITIPSTVKHIDNYAFGECTSLTSIRIPASVNEIGFRCFYNSGLTKATFDDTSDWFVTSASNGTSGSTPTTTNATTAASQLTGTYCAYYWRDRT